MYHQQWTALARTEVVIVLALSIILVVYLIVSRLPVIHVRVSSAEVIHPMSFEEMHANISHLAYGVYELVLHQGWTVDQPLTDRIWYASEQHLLMWGAEEKYSTNVVMASLIVEAQSIKS